jgi:menaquinone-specific isochorismate synthase
MSSVVDSSAADRLADAVARALREGGAGVQRVAVPVMGVDPLEWLRRGSAGARFYWRTRDTAETIAGAGAARTIDAPDVASVMDVLSAEVASLPAGAAFRGAIRFDPSGEVSPEWAPFGRVRFILPRLVMRVTPQGGTLACHVTPADRHDPDALEAEMALLARDGTLPSGDGVVGGALPSVAPAGQVMRADVPGQANWHAAVRAALSAFGAGALEKVVLARRSTWTLPHPVDPIDVLARLRDTTPGCYLLAIEEDGATFVSATPERLLRFADGRVETEAVAGTRAVGGEAELLSSGKDRHEQALVADDVRARLAPLVDGIDAEPAPTVLALRRRLHLRTRIAGAPRAGARALDVLAALHPTPAVGGYPRDAARAFIAGAEGFDRGLYAGAVGIIGRDARGAEFAEFAVGIRSALLAGRTAALYAGAGVVPGSDPKEEWDEVEGKMSDLAPALGLS